VLNHTPSKIVVTLNCVEGWSAKILWEGILLADLFDEVKVRPSANTVIFHCADGYTTSMPLQTIVHSHLIIAYKANGVTLTPELGFPFQFVAEDKFGYKWAKWITGIELSDDVNYRGYWEMAGYSNEGDVYR
jgi:DMSO/TMAO reductase YedYZ molybdopterin-dependent catalytic subunit